MSDAPKQSEFLSPAEARRLLGCSRALVRKYEAAGRLHAVIDGNGIHRYSRTEVVALAGTRLERADRIHGKLAAEIFQLFRSNVPFADIVIQTQQSPMTIRALWDEYRRPLGVKAAASEARVRAPGDLGDYDERMRDFQRELEERRQRRREPR